MDHAIIEVVQALAPYAVSGGFAGIVAWATARVEQKYLRQDVDNLRYRVHHPKNSRNIVNTLQIHDNRLTVLETLERERHR